MASGKNYLSAQKYFKPNYYEAMKYIIPHYLTEDDIETFGKEVDLRDQVLNSNIRLANDFNTLVPISAIPDTAYSGINNVSGISEYFVKQNNLTNVTTRRFEDKILKPLGVKITDYATSSEFTDYLSGTLLPSIKLNEPSVTFVDGHSASDTHNYLINNLSWLYFLNTSGLSGSFDPSTSITEGIVNTIYRGQPFQTVDGLKSLMEYVWRDGHSDYYPSVFQASTTTFTSGVQQLDNLNTWIDVIYSPLVSDLSDFTVRDRFELFMQNQLFTENKIANGPFTKFIRALSFFAQDINDNSERLSNIYDISLCPDEYLPLLAELIGWDLFGTDPERWRLQLRSAVDVYQTVGTKRSLQYAINTILPKDQFGIETSIVELYESYVPYLIYYALATESSYFKSFDTWNESIASNMNVSGYNSSSIDANVRLAVDRILLDTYESFSSTLGPIPSQEKGFRYRDRVYPIPPFEEYPYYVNFELNQDIVNFIADRVACFGVPQSFALQLKSYIEDNSLNDDSQPKSSSFLLFTSGYNEPPNFASLIASGNNEKVEYASLWSGKSSHYRITFDASSFDFNNEDMSASSDGGSFLVASKLAKDFTPAHAIPLINLELAYINEMGLAASSLPLIMPRCDEQEARPSRNYFTSGVYFDSYMRDVRPGGEQISKSYFNNTSTSAVVSGTNAINIPRTSLRRRNYEKLLPSEGYYDRTGFNMPTEFSMASGLSGLPLGLIPSSLSYAPVTDHVNLPSVWNSCEGFNSANTYFEVDVSNTLNVRGASGSFASNKDLTIDRGQLSDIHATMHAIKERAKVVQAMEAHKATTSLYSLSVSDVFQSYANSATEYSGDFPNSVEDFYNFSFGKDLHKLYRVYTQEYNQHALNGRVMDQDGPNVFSHTFGPILYNHDFENVVGYISDGAASSYVTSALSSAPELTPFSKPFQSNLSYIASGADDMFLTIPETYYPGGRDTNAGEPRFDFVLSGAVSGVELVNPSGPGDNSFSIFKIPGQYKKSTDDPYMFDNTFVSMKVKDTSEGQRPRVRFDMGKYKASPESPIATNFLLPEHEFSGKLKFLITDNNGNLGGRRVSIWIHTKPEDGKMWSYVITGKPNRDNLVMLNTGQIFDTNRWRFGLDLPIEGSWVQHTATPDAGTVDFQLANSVKIEPVPPQDTSASPYACIESIPSTQEVSPVLNLKESDFNEISFTFNTRNRDQDLPREYRQNHSLLHRKDQGYVIEIFLYGGNPDSFLLLDSLELQDMTLKKMSEIFVTGQYQDPLCDTKTLLPNCPEYRVDLSKEELQKVFRFFNDISGKNSKTGLASRNKNETSTIMGTDGGSKLDYRYKKEFFEAYKPFTITDQINIDV